jgi:hypothetical protein
VFNRSPVGGRTGDLLAATKKRPIKGVLRMQRSRFS